MDKLNQMIILSTYAGPETRSSTKPQYSVEKLRAQSLQMCQKPSLNSEPANLPMVLSAYSFSFSKKMVNQETGILTSYGQHFIDSYEATSRDFRLLFSFFPRHSEPPHEFDSMISEPMTPFLYWIFCHEFSDTISLYACKEKSDSVYLSQLCRYLITSSKSLCLCRTFADLKAALTRFTKKDNPKADLSVLNSIFEQSYSTTVAFEPGQKGASARSLLKSAIASSSSPTHNSLLNFNTFLHERAQMIDTSWVYEREDLEQEYSDFSNSAVRRLLFSSSMVGDLISDSKLVGNAHISIELSPYSARDYSVQLKYCHKKCDLALVGTVGEAVLPAFDKKELTIVIFSNASRQSILKEIKVPSIAVNLSVSQSITFSSSIKITSRVEAPLKVVRLEHTSFGGAESPRDCFDFMAQMLVEEWLKSFSPLPPRDILGKVLDFCISYSVPSSYMFSAIVSKLSLSWVDSPEFIEIFTPTFLTYYAATEQCQCAELEKVSLSTSLEFLRSKVPKLLMTFLSKPDYFEKTALTSLLILLSLFFDESKLCDFISSVVQDSVTNIVDSVLSVLKFDAIDKPGTPTAVSLFSVSGGENYDRRTEGIPMIRVDTSSLVKAMTVLFQRFEGISSFFSHQTIPSFASHRQSIITDLSSLSYLLAKAFSECDLPPEEIAVQFISIYKKVWRMFGSVNQHNPSNLFQPIIVKWITEVGNSLIAWSTRAVQLDEFAPISSKQPISTSLVDLFCIFNESFQFVDHMKLESEEVKTLISSFLSLCSSSVRLYRELVTESVKEYLKKEGSTKVKSLSQCLVCINNLASINGLWEEYMTKFCHTYAIESQIFEQPTKGVAKEVKDLVDSLEGEIEWELHSAIYMQIWSERKAFGKTFLSLNKRAENDQKAYSDLAEKIVTESMECIKCFLFQAYRKRGGKAVLKGLEKAVAEVLSPFDQSQIEVMNLYKDNFKAIISSVRHKLDSAEFEG